MQDGGDSLVSGLVDTCAQKNDWLPMLMEASFIDYYAGLNILSVFGLFVVTCPWKRGKGGFGAGSTTTIAAREEFLAAAIVSQGIFSSSRDIPTPSERNAPAKKGPQEELTGVAVL